MSGTITVEVKTTKALMRMRKIAGGMSKERLFLTNYKLSIDLANWVARNFASEGQLWSPGGWQQLAPSTLAARARRIENKGKRATVRKLYRAGKSMSEVGKATRRLYGSPLGQAMILQDTGYMRQSFHPFFDSTQAGVGTPRGLFHADISYFHQHGDRSRNLPARPMLPTREQALDMGLKVYELHVRKMVAGESA